MSTRLRGLFVVLGFIAFLGTTNCDNSRLRDILAPSPLPCFSTVRALSSHYLDVRLASPAGAEAALSSNYTILSPDGTSLSVLAANLSDDGRQVILTTADQSVVEYRITSTAALVSQTSSCVGTAPDGSIGFIGSSAPEPFVKSAV